MRKMISQLLFLLLINWLFQYKKNNLTSLIIALIGAKLIVKKPIYDMMKRWLLQNIVVFLEKANHKLTSILIR
ncbi:hypothetical protein [Terrilactibacillus laevilacticus]|uniref:Uncharacterized protein n=1 Tax=Terrilactibacillus laevilacticus TaxID=1380157 RepID=A0ABW5PTU8_9BACI|nr:hypothetical protein [Terrilactibacillus laevilacticus]